MFRVMNDYLAKVRLLTNSEIYNKVNDFIVKLTDIKKYSININFNRYIVDIRLEEFSIELAEEYFKAMIIELSYPYSSMFLRYNEGNRVSYRFLSCKEDKTGFYMDIIFS